jgi:hypothetical protein
MLRTTRTALVAASIFAASLASSLTASAQDQESGEIEVDLPERKRPVVVDESPRFSGKPGPLRVYGGFSLAVGGNASYELEVFGEEREFEADLDPTFGLTLPGIEYVVMDYFSIGGELRWLFFKQDGDDGRSFLWDIVVKPKGRYAFSNIPLEVYGALPLGLTVPGLKGEAEGGVGFNLGLVGGATWFFNERMGINAEIGWHYHRFGMDARGDDVPVSMNQFLLLSPNFVYVL